MTINFKTTWKWIKKGIKVFIFVAILAAAIYWAKFTPVPVETYQAERGKIVGEVMGTGTLDAKIKAIISSKISGRIEEVLVDQGDKVVAGQLLVKLDDDQLKQQVKIALAGIETARSGVDRAKSDLEFAAAVLDMAKKNYARHKTLLPQNATSQAEFEKAVEGLAVAKAGVKRAQAEITESRKKVAETDRTLAFRQSQLEDSQIQAPFDGIILYRERDPGNVVVPGSEILSLISTEILWIRAWIGETERAKIKLGQPARVIFRSQPEHPYPGHVARLAVEVDKERGIIEDATLLIDKIGADIWVVQSNTRGPFAEISRIPQNIDYRTLAIPGVVSARKFVQHTIQRKYKDKRLRMTVVGLDWPVDKGEWLPLSAGRILNQNHYEMVADKSLSMPLGAKIMLGKDTYTVVGITSNMISSGGDGIGFFGQ